MALQLVVDPPGTILVVSAEQMRDSDFLGIFYQIEKPTGTVVMQARGIDVARNRNDGVLAMEGDWLWMLDDDHVIPADTLTRLLADLDRTDFDILCPHVLRREPPWESVAYIGGERLDTGALSGIVQVDAIGTAGMLIRRRVFEAIDAPWFVQGESEPDRCGEDVSFCARATRAGFRIGLDCDVAIGHFARHVVWPAPVDADGRRRVLFGTGRGTPVVVYPEQLEERRDSMPWLVGMG